MLSFFNVDNFFGIIICYCVLIDFMLNLELLDHNTNMQEELKEANHQPTNVDNSTCTIDVKVV